MLSNLSLRVKLFLLAFLGVAGTVVVGAIGYVSLERSIAAARDLTRAGAAQRAQMNGDMMHDAIRLDVYSALLAAQTADDRRAKLAGADLAAHAEQYRRTMREAWGTALSPEVVAAVDSIVPRVETYVTRAQAVQQAATGDPIVLAQAIVAFDDAFKLLDVQVEALGDEIKGRAISISSEAEEQFTLAKLVVATVALAAIVIALFFGFRIERRITCSVTAVVERVGTLRSACITELRSALIALTRGDLGAMITPRTQPLPVTSKDEIGTLTATVNDIISQTQATVGAFEEARGILRGLITETNRLAGEAKAGNLRDRGHEAAFDGSFRELVQGINHTLDAVLAPINAATDTLEKLAQRDLTTRVQGEYTGDHARIQQSLNSAMDKLSEALGAVAATAADVATGAGQIDSGSKALARGASDQAASLEEVSASARELAAMTKRNAASAAEGRSLADGARSSTSEGVAEAQRLAEAIARIKASSEATAKIVKTIDEIAFQTNLLALNAAVEAARAGDSGRGFAVVADEVRSLAMRSAEAARSTAQLIDESVRSTEQGVALNDKVLSQLSEIDDRVNRVGQVVGEIAAASDEQARGVELIDRALDGMSQRTQAVAASADESEAASRNLLGQSDALRALVGEFRLGRSSARAIGGSPAVMPLGASPAAARAQSSIRTSSRKSERPSRHSAPPRVPAFAEQPEIAIPLDDDDWNSMQNF